MVSMLLKIDQSAKSVNQVRCSRCATTLIIRHGTYFRADPVRPTLVKIQRYLCKSPECPRRTFSVLPFPLLPIVRHTFGTHIIGYVLGNALRRPQSIVSGLLEITRGRTKRLSEFCREFIPWFYHEAKIADWGTNLLQDPARFWADFTRDFSQRFYPARWDVGDQHNSIL
jgi:hypothetical protein